jgi:hypothetical protein
MSTATTLQSGPLHLSQARSRLTRKALARLPQRMNKSALLEPLQALVEARMRKTIIEIELRRRSGTAASTKRWQGGTNAPWRAVLQRGATGLFSRFLGKFK